MLQCGIGAINVNNELLIDDFFIEPPFFVDNAVPKITGKTAAKANVDHALKVKNFIEELYRNESSPFYHGFTTYYCFSYVLLHKPQL